MNQYRVRLLAAVIFGLYVCGFSNPILAQTTNRLSTEKFTNAISVNELQQNTTNDSDKCSAFIDCDSTEKLKLTVSNAGAEDRFGQPIASSGNHIFIGSAGDSCEDGLACGSVYIYHYDGMTFIQEQKIVASDADEGDRFGFSISISGNYAIVGAWLDECKIGSKCGSAYVFHFDGTKWNEVQKLTAFDAAEGDGFGFAVSLSNDIAIIGAPNDECDNGEHCGSAYIYRLDGTIWMFEQKLIGSDVDFFDNFGWGVSVDNDRVIVGSILDHCSSEGRCGAAYIFHFDGTRWIEEQKLIAEDDSRVRRFGRSVSIRGGWIVVGDNGTDCISGEICGAVYVYRFVGNEWIEQQKLTAFDADENDQFGFSVSISDDIILVGAWLDDCANGIFCGSAYIYQRNGTEWTYVQKITASDADVRDYFGISVSIFKNYAFVAAAFDDCKSGNECGSVYVFDLTDEDCNCNDTADACEVDTDEDGIIECDECPDSIMDETVVINGCDTGVTNSQFDDGCTMADVLSECVSDLRSRGRDVSCVNDVARGWLRDRFITGREYSRIVSCAAGSNNLGRNVGINIHRQNDNSSSKRQQP